MNLIEIAKSVDQEQSKLGGDYQFNESQLQAFADAITKEKDAEIEKWKQYHFNALAACTKLTEEIERLKLLRDEYQNNIDQRDAEIESINLAFDSAQQELDARSKEVAMQALEIEQLKYENQELHRDWNQRGIDNIELNAKVAMMREAFNQLLDCESEIFSIGVAEAEHITEALSATEQDVTRWFNGVKADALEECRNMFIVNSVSWKLLDEKLQCARGEQV